MPLMAKEKKRGDLERYRKPRRMAGVPEVVARQVDVLVKLGESDFTEEVRRLVIEGLERRGLWPPPEKRHK
jgi:hypothetical protein